MECPRCHTEYHKETNIPLLLIKCGHTLCSNCANEIFTGNSVTCPDCGCKSVIKSIESLPKNMALLTIYQPVNDNNQEALCKIHNKKVEAFCGDDRVLLCIDCILIDGHKSHDISPISKAYERELSNLQGKMKSVEEIETSLLTMLSDIDNAKADLTENANESRDKITNIFNEIRNTIHERESSLPLHGCNK